VKRKRKRILVKRFFGHFGLAWRFVLGGMGIRIVCQGLLQWEIGIYIWAYIGKERIRTSKVYYWVSIRMDLPHCVRTWKMGKMRWDIMTQFSRGSSTRNRIINEYVTSIRIIQLKIMSI
jgi:hypothetical protein